MQEDGSLKLSTVFCVLAGIMYAILVIQGKEEDIRLKNKIILAIVGISKVEFLFGCNVELYFKGLRPYVYIIVAGACIILWTLDVLIYMYGKNDKYFKYYMYCYFLVQYVLHCFLIIYLIKKK